MNTLASKPMLPAVLTYALLVLVLSGCGDVKTAQEQPQLDMTQMPPALDMTLPDLDLDLEPDTSSPALYEQIAYEDIPYAYQTDYPVGENLQRELLVRLWFPQEARGQLPVVIISHGGPGNTTGHQRFEHIGRELAAHGYLSMHINHRPSINGGYHRWDRPNDVSALLDQLEAQTLARPEGLNARPDLTRVAHLGHSWGAYTAHAVAGGRFEDPLSEGEAFWSFRDERIKAIVALSPQGWEGFGAFDQEYNLSKPSADNSWKSIQIPSYCLIGSEEKDGEEGGFKATDWRLTPFYRYPSDGQRYLAVIPGQTHSDMASSTPEVNAYIAQNTRLFFDVYLKQQMELKDQIGELSKISGVKLERR